MSSPILTTDIQHAASVLLNGGIIGMPTETVYGLAGLALRHSTVKRIYDTKQRPYDHPLIVHLSPNEDFTRWGKFNNDALALASQFWPGPLTLLVPRTELVPDWVTGGRDTVALRVPSHVVAIELLQTVADGVVAPSANLFGRVSPTKAQHVLDDLGDNVDLVLDGGDCEFGLESTIVECVDETQILRPGAIDRISVEEIIHVALTAPSGVSRASGMMKSHYSPRAQLVLCDNSESAQVLQKEHKDLGLTTRVLDVTSVPEYARTLYDLMRKADVENVNIIIAVLPSDVGIGTAIRDRLKKASSQD